MIQTGDLVVVHNKFQPFKHPQSILSGAIRFFQWIANGFKWKYAKWNHSEVVYVDSDGTIWLYGALSSGIKKRTLYNWYDPDSRTYKIYREVDKSGINLVDIENRIKNAENIKYDYPSLLFFQLIYRLTFKKIWLGRKDDKADDLLYCSEFYGYVWKEKYPRWYTLSTSDILEKGQLKEIN